MKIYKNEFLLLIDTSISKDTISFQIWDGIIEHSQDENYKWSTGMKVNDFLKEIKQKEESLEELKKNENTMRDELYIKSKHVINSCKTQEHIESARNFLLNIRNFYSFYNEIWNMYHKKYAEMYDAGLINLGHTKSEGEHSYTENYI